MGIVSEADLLPKEEHRDDPTGRHVLSFAGGRASRVKAAGDTAGQVMTANVVVTYPDATLVEAAKEMARHHVKRLPVVDTDNRLVGIISRADLLTVFLRDDEDIRREVISEILIRCSGPTQNASRSRYATESSPCPVSSNSAATSRSPCSSPIG